MATTHSHFQPAFFALLFVVLESLLKGGWAIGGATLLHLLCVSRHNEPDLANQSICSLWKPEQEWSRARAHPKKLSLEPLSEISRKGLFVIVGTIVHRSAASLVLPDAIVTQN